MKQPTIHYVLLSVLLATFAQKALAQKTETSTPVNLTEFAFPPFPVEVVRLEVQAGQLSLLTRMPIAGRPLPISETPKPRGAIFDPSAVYVCQQTLNTQGQPTAPVRGKVFAQALPSASPADFAVFGTQAANGPMRLPLGGTPREMIRDYPQLAQTEPTIQNVWLVSRGQGQNFATYRLSPRFRVVTRETDPQSGQVRSRADEQAPQREATEAKTGAYLVFTEVPLKTSGGFMKADIMLVKYNPFTKRADDVVLLENKLSKGTAYTDRQREGFSQIGQAPTTTMTVEYTVGTDDFPLATDTPIPISRSKCYKIADHGSDQVSGLTAGDIEAIDFTKIR